MNRLYEELFENEERGTRKFEDDAAQDGVSSARAAMIESEQVLAQSESKKLFGFSIRREIGLLLNARRDNPPHSAKTWSTESTVNKERRHWFPFEGGEEDELDGDGKEDGNSEGSKGEDDCERREGETRPCKSPPSPE
jgi:hypothetical protein